MGTLQRLPAIVGQGVAADLALTARNFSGGRRSFCPPLLLTPCGAAHEHAWLTAGRLNSLHLAGTEARELRLVSRVLPDRGALLAEARAIAAAIAAKSPLAVVGTKRVLLYQRRASPASHALTVHSEGRGLFCVV
jgi:enoyl-CoA hydratase/carnithine racemase